MALLETLLADIDDGELRGHIEAEVKRLKDDITFGLVFEKHLPESILLASSVGLHVGDEVRQRSKLGDRRRLRVQKITGKKAEVAEDGEAPIKLDISDVLVVKRFDDTVYPTLTSLGEVRRSEHRPPHLVLEGENFHALELLRFALRGQVDVIYIDPPYNTGARDWKYNNDYVDLNDHWRHSKWLSFMEKRLKIAKDLLKADGVLIVTVDEHEVHHLGALLEDLFAEARRQMVTIVNNAAGVSQGGFYRVEEYAFFCFFGEAKPVPLDDDLLGEEKKVKAPPLWFSLNRYGGSNSVPARRPGLVYPIAVDPKKLRLVGVGKTLTERKEAGEKLGDLNKWKPDPNETVDGYPVVWPFRANGQLATWQTKPETVLKWAQEGFVRVRDQADGAGGNAFSLSYVRSGNQKKVLAGEIPVIGREGDDGAYIFGTPGRHLPAKTVWRRTRHDAGKWGSRVLKAFVPGVSFDYPKSPYAVLDALASVAADRPDALIVDFFAGSGTTLQSTLMLNAATEGRRRCILVTNNEVDEPVAKQLAKDDAFAGDPKYEARGIFEAVTRPRCTAAVTGKVGRKKVEGEYLDGRPYADGFEENVEFLRIDYLDGESVELGQQTDALHPLLWLRSGSRGTRPEHLDAVKQGYLVVEDGGYAALFDDAALSDLVSAIGDKDIAHVFVFTDYEDAYTEAATAFGAIRETHLLPRDYLEHFRR